MDVGKPESINVYHVLAVMLAFDLNAVLQQPSQAEPLLLLYPFLPKQKPEIIRVEQTDPGFEHRKLNSEPAL